MLLEAFDSNWIAPTGPDVDAFERELAERIGVGHAVALSSGTAALHLALLLAGVERGRRGTGSVLHLHRQRRGRHLPGSQARVRRLLGRQLEPGPGLWSKRC